MSTVLVVDDEPLVRDVVTRYLERDGHRVLTAESGDAARSLIERERLSLVQAVRDNLADVMRLLVEASSTDEALVDIAALLDVDEVDVMVGLARFDLLALTRPATERRLGLLAELEK